METHYGWCSSKFWVSRAPKVSRFTVLINIMWQLPNVCHMKLLFGRKSFDKLSEELLEPEKSLGTPRRLKTESASLKFCVLLVLTFPVVAWSKNLSFLHVASSSTYIPNEKCRMPSPGQQREHAQLGFNSRWSAPLEGKRFSSHIPFRGFPMFTRTGVSVILRSTPTSVTRCLWFSTETMTRDQGTPVDLLKGLQLQLEIRNLLTKSGKTFDDSLCRWLSRLDATFLLCPFHFSFRCMPKSGLSLCSHRCSDQNLWGFFRVLETFMLKGISNTFQSLIARLLCEAPKNVFFQFPFSNSKTHLSLLFSMYLVRRCRSDYSVGGVLLFWEQNWNW